MVSVGLSATPERKKSISFSRPYVPYAQILGGRNERHDGGDDRGVERLEQDDHVAAGLDRRAARAEDVPERDVQVVPRPERGVPRGRHGPRDGIVVENYLLAQFNKSNGNKLKQAPFPKPLHVEYGSCGVQKGNTKLADGAERVHLQGAEERPAGQDLQVDDRRAAAADAGLQVGARETWPAAPPPATSASRPLASAADESVRRSGDRRRPGRARRSDRGGRRRVSASASWTSGRRSAARSSSSRARASGCTTRARWPRLRCAGAR